MAANEQKAEVETPAWRKALKWSVVIGLPLGLSRVAGLRGWTWPE